MTLATVTTLFWIAAAAALAPVLADGTGSLRVPEVVIEIALGILIGPHILAVAHTDSVINGLSDLGLATLMFLAGYELDLARMKGRPLHLAGAGWLLSVAIALAAAFVLVSTGFALNTLVVGLALTTTALGTLLPILRDAALVGAGMLSVLIYPLVGVKLFRRSAEGASGEAAEPPDGVAGERGWWSRRLAFRRRQL